MSTGLPPQEPWATNPDLDDVDAVELAAVPGLGPLYAKGVLASARLAAARQTTVGVASLPSTHLVVREVRADADRLTAYQHLVGEPGTDVLPAGFVHVMAFPVATALMVREDFPLPLLGMVHLANRVEQRRPLRLGEELDVVVHAERMVAAPGGGERRPRGGRDRRAGGRLARGLDLPRRRAAPCGGRPAAAHGPARVDASAADRPVAAGTRMTPGCTPPSPGDRNPIHSSRLGARAFGFPRTIAHGMHTAARALADVGAARGGAFTWAVEFAAPVLLPGTVTTAIRRDERGFTLDGWSGRSGKRNLTVRVEPRG